jgi:phosphate transport system permease protein
VFFVASVICAGLMLALAMGILLELFRHSIPALEKFGLAFLFTEKWDPVAQEFGGASSAYGTLISTIIALVLAVPTSLAIAMFLVELAPPRVSKVVGIAIELLAAIPSIIYGMWGLFVLAPILSDHVQPALQSVLGSLPLFSGPPMGIGMLTAGLILALMILPYISSIMRDVFSLVPPVVKEAGYGMGATTTEVTRHITVRYGMSGLLGACFLGLGRAIGETMAITFVIGNSHRISASLYKPGTSIASTLANEFGEASEPMHLSSLIYLGLVLFVLTLTVQIIARIWLKRLRRGMGGGV